jgi:hypothetical protein
MKQLKKELQVKLDLLIKEIKSSGYVLKGNKIKELKKIYNLCLDSNYYSHFDGHTSDAIMYDDNVSFKIKGSLLDIVKNNNIEKILFTKNEENCIFYNEEEIGYLTLEYEDCSVFSEWLYELKEFKMIKKNGQFIFDGLLKVDDEQGEHTYAHLYIEEKEKSF